MFGNVNWYFLLTLQQKIETADLKPFLAGKNTIVRIILATTVNASEIRSGILTKQLILIRARQVG